MMTFLTISIGATPATARPLLASTDPDVVRDAVRAIAARVGAVSELLSTAPQASHDETTR